VGINYYLLCVDTFEAIDLGKFSCLDPNEYGGLGNKVSWNVTGWNEGGRRFEGKEFLELIGKFCVLCRDKELRVVSDILLQRIDPNYEAIQFLKIDEVMKRMVDPDVDAYADFDRMPNDLLDRLRCGCSAAIEAKKRSQSIESNSQASQ
jgi:hypothetical protein